MSHCGWAFIHLDYSTDGANRSAHPNVVCLLCRRLATNGPNALTPPPVTPWYIKLLMKFLDPFMLLLELAAVLSLALYLARPREQRSSLYVAVVLLAIIVLTSLLAYYQEGQSARVMGAFQGMMSAEAMVGRPIDWLLCVCGCVRQINLGHGADDKR